MDAAWNLEAVKGPQAPRELYTFNNEADVSSCIVMSDKIIHGFSKSHLDLITPTSPTSTSTSSIAPKSSPSDPKSYARFHGSISTQLPPNTPKIKRTGYAGFRTPDQPPTLFGRAFWDIDPYTYLALRIKSDARSYMINVQTEGVEPTDLHQHRLFARTPGQWETVLVRWNDFVRTNYGFVIEPQTELLRQKVKTVGIGLTDRVEGPFELCIERVWATNGEKGARLVGKGDVGEKGTPGTEVEESELRTKDGKKVHW